MKKILTDRLNELKIEIDELRQPKLTNLLTLHKIADLNIRIDEINKLIEKLK